MKTILISAGVIIIIGGATYALAPRSVLKEYFAVGDKPTEVEFADTIDSALHIQDDAVQLGLKEYNPTKEYVAGDTVVKAEPIYQAKVITQTETEFTLDAVQPVTFRWTPIAPKPQEKATYRLKVWQLMQGQNGTQAMRTNQPIVTKDVDNITQVTVSDLYTGPCKPPYLCDFVWSVELVSAIDTTTGSGSVITPTTVEQSTTIQIKDTADGTR